MRVDDPSIVSAIRKALEAGDGIVLSARSPDTERAVRDRLESMEFRVADLCLEQVDALRENVAPPRQALGLRVDVAPTAASLADPAEARAGGLSEPAGPVYRGWVIRATGIFLQTRKIYAVFNSDGAIADVYVPGVLEVLRRGVSLYAGDASISANANSPLAINEV